MGLAGGLGGAVSSLGAAVGSLFETQGNVAEANSYNSAAQLEEQNASLTAASTRIQSYQEARTVSQSLGTTEADVASAGFTESGSALDILKSSAQQGSLATSLINIQGAINENAFAAEAGSDLAKAKAANEATTAGTISAIASIGGALLSGGESLASGASSLSTAYNYVTGLITGGTTSATAAGVSTSVSGAAASGIQLTGEGGIGTGLDASGGIGYTDTLSLAGNTGLDSTGVIAESTTDASIASGAGLLDSFGAAGIGAIGGDLLASALGENAEGGAIGGAIGAGIGEFVAGPLGAVVGGTLGSIVGGLFGNSKPSDSTEVGGVGLGSGKVQTSYANNESDTGAKYSTTNANIRNSAQQGASNLSSYLIANGATAKNPTSDLVIKVGSRDGVQIGTTTQSGVLTYPVTLSSSATSSQLITSLNQFVLSQYNIPAALQSKLSSVNMGSFYSSTYSASQPLAD